MTTGSRKDDFVSPEEAAKICQLRMEYKLTHGVLAERFGRNRSTISKIISNGKKTAIAANNRAKRSNASHKKLAQQL